MSIRCEPTLIALLQLRLTFFVLPRSCFEFGYFLLLVCSVCARQFISYCHWLQNVLKITWFLLIRARLCVWLRYLCSGIPFYSSNWQIDVFDFEDRLCGTLLVHYFQVKFQLFYAMPYCSILFILSEQYSLSWKILIVVCSDGHSEGSRVSLEHLQSTVLQRASVTSTSISKIYYSKYSAEDELL